MKKQGNGRGDSLRQAQAGSKGPARHAGPGNTGATRGSPALRLGYDDNPSYIPGDTLQILKVLRGYSIDTP
jgi:hypothetical protein